MTGKEDISMSLSASSGLALKVISKIGVLLVFSALAIFLLAGINIITSNVGWWLSGAFLFLFGGSYLFLNHYYKNALPGIKNNGVWQHSLTARGVFAWLLGIVLTGFYVLLYWYPQYLGLANAGQFNTGLISLFDPFSYFLKQQPASQWFVYGVCYTVAILIMGIKFIIKYRHNRYQVIRTISVMFFQTILAFLLPEILQSLKLPYNDFKNAWPLNYYFFDGWHIDEMLHNGTFGIFVLVWGILLSFFITPILTYFYGKRWYCSWVCGCGGLAETAGDPFRQLSDKSLRAWNIERYLIHAVLVFAVLMTAGVVYTYFTGVSKILFLDTYKMREWYGFLIGAAFSGVVGVGFYPLMGSRVWCRFGCPMAAFLGFLQKHFSRFRITTNGGQCISCGNCSTYCEMGIDVKWYAQRGQNIIRSSCVGCGICSAVCPRGVLNLENGPSDKRYNNPITINENGIQLNKF